MRKFPYSPRYYPVEDSIIYSDHVSYDYSEDPEIICNNPNKISRNVLITDDLVGMEFQVYTGNSIAT
jgi:ribosomal protein S19